MGLVETASRIAKRHLDEDGMARLRARYLRAKEQAAPLIRAVRGTFSPEQLIRHLRERIGEDYEILFVHSSLNGLQPMYTGDALGLVKALIAMVRPERTLAMPAFYFGDPAIGGAKATFEADPRFDLRRTPSQMGLPSELFRRTRGVVQSRNPIYRVAAMGPFADALTAGHELSATLCGRGTPFDAMAQRRTMVIGIGKSSDVLTQVHHAEHVMGNAFPAPQAVSPPLPMTLIEGGVDIPYQLPQRGTPWRRDEFGARRLMTRETLREWSFHGAPMFAARAADVSQAVFDAAARGDTIYLRP